MRALILISTSDRRGAEIEGHRLAAELTALGVDASALALSRGKVGPPLEVPVLGDAPLSLATLRRLRRVAAGHDVVVAYGSSTLPACALALPGTRTPFIYRSIGDPRAWAGNRVHRFRTSLLMARAARVVGLWPAAADALEELYRIPRAKLYVIPNARSASEFHPPTADERIRARLELGADDGELVVALIGSLAPEKRVDLALEALATAEPARVVIAGDGPERARLEGLVASSPQLARRTRFLGHIGDVRPVLRGSDVVLSTSSTEGMPGTFIEAGLTGIPVVATDVGAVRWMLERRVFTGHLLPRDPAPENIIAGLHEAASSAITRVNADTCSWSAVAPRWLQVLDAIAMPAPAAS